MSWAFQPLVPASADLQAGPGAQTLTQSARFDNSNSFYAHSVTTGPVSLSQSARFDNAPTFYTQTITIGTVNLVADRFDNTNTYYAHSLSQGAGPQSLVQTSRFDNTNAFYQHTVTVGSVTLYPAFYQNQNTFFAHRIGGLEGKITYAYAFTQVPTVVTTSKVLRAEVLTAAASAEVLTKQSAVSAKRRKLLVMN